MFQGGPPTDLKIWWTVRSERGKVFYQKICKKAFIIKKCFTQHHAKYFFNSFKEIVRIDLFYMENVKYMAIKFVLTVLVFDIVFDFFVCLVPF